MSLLDPQASPSDLTESGVLNRARVRVERMYFDGAFADGDVRRIYMPENGRVIAAHVYRAEAGDDGTTTVDIHAKKGSAAEASIVDAAVSIAFGDGENVRSAFNLDVDADGHGVALSGGDYIEAQIDAIEGDNRADLLVEVQYLIG